VRVVVLSVVTVLVVVTAVLGTRIAKYVANTLRKTTFRYKMKKLTVLFFFLISSCSSILINQEVVQSWTNIPVSELDTHSWFLTVPMIKTITDDGLEIRNYRNGQTFSQCTGSGGGSGTVTGNTVNVSTSTFQNCLSGEVACNNMFYIKDNIVLEYTLVGNCRTANYLKPEYRFSPPPVTETSI